MILKLEKFEVVSSGYSKNYVDLSLKMRRKKSLKTKN